MRVTPAATHLHLDVNSTIGSIRSELETADERADERADLSLRLRATTGDVTLRRALQPTSNAGV